MFVPENFPIYIYVHLMINLSQTKCVTTNTEFAARAMNVRYRILQDISQNVQNVSLAILLVTLLMSRNIVQVLTNVFRHVYVCHIPTDRFVQIWINESKDFTPTHFSKCHNQSVIYTYDISI